MKADIENCSLEIIPGIYYYAKIPRHASLKNHFMISDDGEEVTIVTKNLPNSIIERNKEEYSLIKLNVSVPFYSVGFLATVSNAVADLGINILIISTYSKDYLLVRKQDEMKTKSALIKIGMRSK